MKKVFAAAAQKKVADSLLAISEKQVIELNNQIELLGEKETELKAMYEGQVSILKQEIVLFKDQMKGYEKLVRREKRKRFFATAGGILTTGIVTYLAIKK